MPKVRTQADRRQHATITDRHGRKFWTVIEKDTMRSCSALIPKGWEPPKLFGKTPFVPPEAYITYAVDDPFEMTVNYDLWIADTEREHEAYAQRMSAAAIMLFGSGAAEQVKKQSPELLNYVGKPPTPVAPIKAARAGNLFVLGLSPNMPKWAAEFFTAPVKVEELFPNAEDDYPDEEALSVAMRADEASEFPDVEEPADAMNIIVDEELERALDLEEQHDPKATGGTSTDPRAESRRVPIEKPVTKPKAKARA
ncbi:MAG: hypothetical protein M3P26_12885 [Gemmatimonadota bacterium]|nr:hypothetical protein [Gemmatimonadota bacterium]